MKFYTNKISTSKPLNFNEFIEKLASKNSGTTKTAQAVKGEEECLEGSQDKLPIDLKKKIIEKKKEDGECKVEESKSDGAKGSKETEAGMKKEECYASNTRFVRIANLDEKTKNEWKSYWKKLYPSEYVDAMFADK